MSHFYGTMSGAAKNLKTVTGTKKTGLTVKAKTTNADIVTTVWYDRNADLDRYSVEIRDELGNYKTISEGIIPNGFRNDYISR